MKFTKPVFQIALGVVVLFFAGSAIAQSGSSMDSLGGGMWDAICEFLKSPIVTVVAAIALISLIVLWMLDESRGFVSTLLKIGIGAAIILNIATVLSLLQLPVPGC